MQSQDMEEVRSGEVLEEGVRAKAQEAEMR